MYVTRVGCHIGRPFVSAKMNVVVEMAKHKVDNLDLVGIIVYGENRKVDKALDGLKFHD